MCPDLLSRATMLEETRYTVNCSVQSTAAHCSVLHISFIIGKHTISNLHLATPSLISIFLKNKLGDLSLVLLDIFSLFLKLTDYIISFMN